MLADLFAHQEWADAKHWRALRAHGTALADPAVRARLHHIHLVQNGFLSAVADRPFLMTQPEDVAEDDKLLSWARQTHRSLREVVAGMTPDRLAETIAIPWFQDPPLAITREQALMQCAMHSHYHRGQNAVRLRELEGKPPLVDFIAWLWQGKPEGQWEKPAP